MKRHLVLGASAMAALAVLGFGAWLSSLPDEASSVVAPTVPQAEMDAMLASLRPPKQKRPLIAIIGINDATETTDYLMPAGILRRADVADVMMLATGSGPVQLFPALKVQPDATIASFDAAHPQGADYVIVPAMSRDDDPLAIDWIRSQSRKGAKIIAVCAGAKVAAAAHLLDGRNATTHWYYLKDMIDRHPAIRYVPNRRMVVDRGVATTTGITASMPMMLTLIEAIAGRGRAEAVARDLGLLAWDARHPSGRFMFTRPFATTVLANTLAFWNRDEFGIEARPGLDGVSLALVADAWSRTYRSKALTFAESGTAVETRDGIRILPDRISADWSPQKLVSTYPGTSPAAALDRTLAALATNYGKPTANVVAMQLEYPGPVTLSPSQREGRTRSARPQ